MHQQILTHQISVIIPSYNGARKLPCAIRGLASQTILPTEVVVVVDGSLDDTQDVLIGLSLQFPSLNIRPIYQNNTGRAGAKNRGISEASFDLLVFMDDDMEPVPRWLEQHYKHHQHISGSIASGSLSASSYSAKSDLRAYQEWLHNQWHPAVSSSTSLLTIPYIHAGNFSVHRSTLTRIGNFKDGLLDCEDRLLAITAVELSIPLYLLSLAQCIHHDTYCSDFEGMGMRSLQYEEARVRLVSLNPKYLQYPVFQPFRPRFPKLLIYLLFSPKIFLQFADAGLFSFLPPNLRYRFYSLLLTAFSRMNSST